MGIKTYLAGIVTSVVIAGQAAAAPTPIQSVSPSAVPIAPIQAPVAQAPVQLAHWAGGRRHYHPGYRPRRYYRRDRRRARRALGIGAAIVGGAIIADSIARSRRDRVYDRGYRVSDRHMDWCYRRYRSYRASDNTFQPYRGGRRQCFSPYN